MQLAWAFLGTVDYGTALALQTAVRDEVRAGARPDTLLLLEHAPVVTLGRSADARHVRATRDELERRGIACRRVGRGGQVTYHGPGQLVGYPIRRVGRAIRAHLRGIGAALQAFLADLGVAARWDDRAPGLWTDRGKIVAVGVDARGGVAMHGFALNLSVDLAAFDLIVPCGDVRPVTSVRALLGASPSPGEAAPSVAALLARCWGVAAVAVPFDESWVGAAAAACGDAARDSA